MLSLPLKAAEIDLSLLWQFFIPHKLIQ